MSAKRINKKLKNILNQKFSREYFFMSSNFNEIRNDESIDDFYINMFKRTSEGGLEPIGCITISTSFVFQKIYFLHMEENGVTKYPVIKFKENEDGTLTLINVFE